MDGEEVIHCRPAQRHDRLLNMSALLKFRPSDGIRSTEPLGEVVGCGNELCKSRTEELEYPDEFPSIRSPSHVDHVYFVY
jgi:hypothetical protein